MRPEAWIPTVPAGDGPLTLRIARGVVADIEAGRLRPGQRLPGARPLALRLGLHRNTVAAALADLGQQGWLRSAPRSGWFVADSLPFRPVPQPHGVDLPLPERWVPPLPRPDPPGALVLHGGRPDLRLLPLLELGRAWRRVLRGSGRKLVDYGDPQGVLALRRALSAFLARHRGLAVEPDGLLVTRGAQQALALVAMSCFRPGDRVGVEALGYGPTWAALRLAGVEPVPIPLDEGGLRVDLLRAHDLAGVYVTPHHQFPTMVPLRPDRRVALLALARERGLYLIEDDYDHEMVFNGQPRLPLAHADPRVIYVSTLSKALAPGLRIGFVAGPPSLLDRMTRLRVALDRQGDAVTERAVAELLDEGLVDRHIARTRRIYAERGAALAAACGPSLGAAIEAPTGGLALWVPSPVDPGALRVACESRGVSFRIGADYAWDQDEVPYLRLGYANLDLAELDRAMRVIGEVAARLTDPSA